MTKTEQDLTNENARLKTQNLLLEAKIAELESRLGLRPKSKLIPEALYDRHPVISAFHDRTVDAFRRLNAR